MKSIFISFLSLFLVNVVSAQLTITAANTSIQTGAILTVQGDITSTKNIPDMGKLLLQGSVVQSLNMNGNSIPNLEINNSSNILLTGNMRVSNTLLFTNGKIVTGNFNLSLSNISTITGMGGSKFIQTNGSGQVLKEISSNLNSIEIPVGAGTIYRPVYLTTSGTYSGASVGVWVSNSYSAKKPPLTSDFLKTNWTITRTGISGTLNASAQYNDIDISGNENNLKAYLYNGTDWSSTIGSINTSTNRVSFPINIPSANITAIDKFDLLLAKAFLQAVYNSGTGLMSDNLRTPSNIIPLSDPYSTSSYNTAFTRVNNPITETIDPFVLADQSSVNNNIVDWVFLELRNTSAGNNVIQTRSALLQRDGDIVDIDGISPVTFNNVSSGNYTIAVRHRNHLGISTDPAIYTPSLDEKYSTLQLVDFTTSTKIYGGSTAYGVSSGKNILWGGNSNLDNKVLYNGFQNDKDFILTESVNNPSRHYTSFDINMDGVVNYNGFINDKDFLYKVLGNSSNAQRNQSLP